METNKQTENYIRIGISLAAISLLAIHLSASPSLEIDAIGFSLVILGILPWLVLVLKDYLRHLKFFGQGLDFNQLQEGVKKQEKELQYQQKIIQLIREALKRSLTKHEYQHLLNLDSGSNTPYNHCDFLEKEMIKLCQQGYANERTYGSVWEMKKIGRPFYLREFFDITNEGKEYLKLTSGTPLIIFSP